ncbi:MAG: NADH-quinone oxidoreductase subunit L [Oscillospiraceae bacterium]|nr:NADH-quinone oxidoreductase subunit L [Oscillospiraceae bacterium]
MLLFAALLFFPLVTALALFLCRNATARKVVVWAGSVVTMALSIAFCFYAYNGPFVLDLSNIPFEPVVMAVDVLITIYLLWVSVKRKSPLIGILAIAQTGAFLLFKCLSRPIEVTQTVYVDKLSILMVAIVGIIGSIICIYAAHYMDEYHKHHPEIKDRRSMFFGVLFVFMSAMFGLVCFNDLPLLLFCWEITSLASFLLIGYSRTKEAIKNASLAIIMNLFGGLCFTLGVIIAAVSYGVADLNTLMTLPAAQPLVTIIVFLLCVAGLTKSAQLPFSKWLLGAMVAPTPTSAILHSSTMVKAGVYLILRLSPMLGKNINGTVITLVGGITFFAAAVAAVSQTDAKKILAYSTISNLGLIVACAGINTSQSLWAAIMLIIFHAIAKSLLFLTVGSAENRLGSRSVEDMDGLIRISRSLTVLMVTGIAGMFVAPFGMLISKWAAMKAFMDSNNIVLLLFVAFGSSITLFFWTKWLGKLIANAHRATHDPTRMVFSEKLSLFTLAAMVILVCLAHPFISDILVAPFLSQGSFADFVSPINDINSLIIVIMMAAMFALPLLLSPLYRHNRVKQTSVYLSGENTGDDESYYGAMGQVKQVQLRNWYLTKLCGERRIMLIGILVSAAFLVIGFFLLVKGVIL